MNLSLEQQSAFDHLVRHIPNRPVQSLGGYAGTGKTVIASHLYHRLPRFKFVTPTGKAADVARRKGVAAAATIHSTIYEYEQNDDGTYEQRLKSGFELGDTEGFLIDEASMVSRDLFRDLQSFALPIIAIGDHGQLPPVGEDAGLMRNPDIRLETVHRNAGPIAKFAEHLRHGYRASAWIPDAPTDAVRVATRASVTDTVLMTVDQVICAYNRTRVNLNRRIRRACGLAKNAAAADVPVHGDRVMCLKNSREFGVFNGQQGKIAGLYPEARTFSFAPDYAPARALMPMPKTWNHDKLPLWRKGDPVPFDFCYAITCHKSQGDQWGSVLVLEERSDLWDPARWAYTAVSRAEKLLIFVP